MLEVEFMLNCVDGCCKTLAVIMYALSLILMFGISCWSVQPADVTQEECSICLETPVAGDFVRRLPCMHVFHQPVLDSFHNLPCCLRWIL
jgi:hypothetical protein